MTSENWKEMRKKYEKPKFRHKIFCIITICARKYFSFTTMNSLLRTKCCSLSLVQANDARKKAKNEKNLQTHVLCTGCGSTVASAPTSHAHTVLSVYRLVSLIIFQFNFIEQTQSKRFYLCSLFVPYGYFVANGFYQNSP